jgi:hypothetical protein
VSAPGLAALLIVCAFDGGDAVRGFASCRLLFGGALGGPLGSHGLHCVGGLTEP